MKKTVLVTGICLMLVFLSAIQMPALAGPAIHQTQAAVVRAVLFYSPGCGHCHKVMEEDLPPLREEYGSQLEILEIDMTQPAGRKMFDAGRQAYGMDMNSWAVPTLFIGDTVLVGSVDIPEQLPGLIALGLANGGLNWPAIPGLVTDLATPEVGTAVALTAAAPTPAPATSPLPAESTPVVGNPTHSAVVIDSIPQPQSDQPVWVQKFLGDPLANTLAVVILIGMVIVLGLVAYWYVNPPESGLILRKWPEWLVPVVCLLGLGVAGYLTYVETTGTEAVCGPVGNCNSVQQSKYATLLGFLPVGVFGLLGYLGILAAWLVQKYGSKQIERYASYAMWAMAIFGVLFSIYLTFLEPFVIGASCAWCLTSALLITLLLWISTRRVIEISQ